MSDGQRWLAKVWAEYTRAQAIFPDMRSQHEGYAILKEELDEAWDEIKRNDEAKATEEMVQVAAMALRFLIDVGRR